MYKIAFQLILSLLFILNCGNVGAQNSYIISGKVMDAATDKPLQNVTIHLRGSNTSTLSKLDGSFNMNSYEWHDSLEITSVGYDALILGLQKAPTVNINALLKSKSIAMDAVIIGTSKKSGKSFMEKVIDNKSHNNPSRFNSFSYQRYTRSELDLDNVDFAKAKGSGIKSLMFQAYANVDTGAKWEKSMPIYFSEKLANIIHTVSPAVENENIFAQKNLGLKTDNILSKLEKYYFNFNVYDDWLPIFDQSYVSPLNVNAFNYYKYFEGDTVFENGDTIRQIRFVPLRAYEKAFSGTLWINATTLGVQNIDMHLTKTANLNLINDISYSESYLNIYDSVGKKMVYMPYKFSSDVKFETGIALLGIPQNEKKDAIKLIFKNTTVIDKVKLSTKESDGFGAALLKKVPASDLEKADDFWASNRLDSLTNHEKNIYKMVDSLKQNKRFQRDIKLVAFAGTGYWDFGKQLRIGPYSSFISSNSIEGWRVRLGFWTMPGISKKINVFGYGAYGTKDKMVKGMLGLKYIWNAAKWTKSSLVYGSDYDFIIDEDDELDKDNIINSLLRKNIPFTRTYIKSTVLKHEQYLSPNFSIKASLGFKVLDPVFDFQFRSINPVNDKPYDSVFETKLSVSETSIGIRYARNERSTIINYDKLRLGTFSPIFSANYTFGFEHGKGQFDFHKINLSVEQRLRLPPKSFLFYKIDVGKVIGLVPYILLNVPAGNEFYVSSKYQFNTMSPYEFASDTYASLHTRFYLGGALLDKISFIRKLGWRERFSFNAYTGKMNESNLDYNKNSNFNVVGNAPFMEASAGIENIFHIISIEYYRRLSYLNHPYAKKEGIYLGLTLSF